MTASRASHERRGRRAEWLAAVFLVLKGYRVIARRFKAAGGEIDIIARKPGLLVFVEVKERPTVEAALTALTPRGRRRIESAGRSFLARRPRFAADSLRYDLIAVAGFRLRHAEDAFREGDAHHGP